MIKVFYDGKCGLCNKEINHYKKIAKDNVFEWIDVTKTDQSILSKENLDLISCLKILHVKDNENKLHIGVDAFICIWNELNKWRKLAIIIKLPVIYTFSKKIYIFFAKWRFKNLNYCKYEN